MQGLPGYKGEKVDLFSNTVVCAFAIFFVVKMEDFGQPML